MHFSSDAASGFPPEALLLGIVARAATLNERLSPLCRPESHPQPDADPLVASRLDQWRCILQRDGVRSPDTLAKRLTWDGLDHDTMVQAVGPVSWSDPLRLPGWAFFLAETMADAVGGMDGATPATGIFTLPPETKAAIPFFDLWQPFLRVARQHLAALAGSRPVALAPEAATTLAEDLVRQLASLGAPSAQEKFASFRAGSSLASRTGNTGNSIESYQQFLTTLLQDGLGTFFEEYSALARQLCLRTQQWVGNTARLLARLEADRTEIAKVFLQGEPLGAVRALRPGLSDRHHGGQQVAGLEFQGGLRLIYKPKSLDQEGAFQDLLRWLEEQADQDGSSNNESLPLPPAIRVLNRGDYGWVQCVEPSPCETAAEVERYYQRAGSLLCLLHALGGNDCHRDNVFAIREGPVLVDIESLLQPTWDPTAPEKGAAVRAPSSVLQTGLLPLWKRGTDGEFADVGGLSGQGNRRTRLRRRVWREINTDGMHLAEEPVFTIATANLPSLLGEPQPAANHSGALVAGFEACYRFLLRHRRAMVGPGGPLHALGQVRSRLICRPSSLYGKLLRALTEDTRYARDGFDRSIAIEALARPLLLAARRPGLWPLLAAERFALEEGDVPFFTVAQAAAVLGIEPEKFAPDFAACLERLEETDLKRQVEIIRASLLKTMEAEFDVPLARALTAIPADLPQTTGAGFIAEARRLAAEIVARAEINEQGTATWLSPDALRPGVDGARGAPLYLYGGAPGVALFLAALDRVTGDHAHREVIRAACLPITAFLDSPDFHQWIDREPLGAGLGLGGVVYALARIGDFLGDGNYLETAARVARWILSERILTDTTYDVLSGSAGAVLGLLAFHQITGEAFALDLAVRCGRHLCARARPVAAPGTGVAWPTGRNGALLAGFAHGAAGIGYALARLHAATGGEERLYLDTARSAAAYERTIFSVEAGNWPVVPPPDAAPQAPLFLSTWCHGAPGIILGRVGAMPALDDADIRRDLALALKSLLGGGLSMIDHLCCGNLGRAEIAWTASQLLGRPDLGKVALAAGSHVVGQAARAGGSYRLRVDEAENRFFEAGFFRGISGIGYGLLRLARPELPCVLLFA